MCGGHHADGNARTMCGGLYEKGFNALGDFLQGGGFKELHIPEVTGPLRSSLENMEQCDPVASQASEWVSSSVGKDEESCEDDGLEEQYFNVAAGLCFVHRCGS